VLPYDFTSPVKSAASGKVFNGVRADTDGEFPTLGAAYEDDIWPHLGDGCSNAYCHGLHGNRDFPLTGIACMAKPTESRGVVARLKALGLTTPWRPITATRRKYEEILLAEGPGARRGSPPGFSRPREKCRSC
jgi:hypothetical protein